MRRSLSPFRLLACLVCSVIAQNTTTTGAGDYILQGLSAATTNNSSSASETAAAGNASSSGLYDVSGLPTSFPISLADPTWTLSTTGAGASYATACNLDQLLYAYLTTSQLYYGEQTASTTYTTTTNYTATVTTLCDGYERVVGSLTPVATGTNSTVFQIPAATSAVPSPICSVSPDDYQIYLEDAWSSAYYYAPNTTIMIQLDEDLTAMTTAVENGSSTTVTLGDGSATTPPPLVIGGTTYAANEETTYYVQVNPQSLDSITPGGSLTVTQFAPGAYFMPQYNVSSQSVTSAIETNITEGIATATAIVANTTASEDCPCTIAGRNVRLMYFPETASVTKDLCKTGLAQGTFCPHAPTPIPVNAENSVSINIDLQVNQGTACPIPPMGNLTKTKNSGPYTVSSGTTFYQNRAYLAFDVLSATRACGYAGGVAGQLTSDDVATTTFVGGEYSNGVIEIASTDLYSGCGYSYFYDALGYSVNYADFQEPVPASAFLCQPACYEAVAYSTDILAYGDYINGELADPYRCSIILESEYKPQLLIPPQARTLDPAWSTCVLKLNGLKDPPVALQVQQSAEGPAVPTPYSGETATTAPSPASSPTTGSAPQTSAIADSLPTSTSVAGPSSPFEVSEQTSESGTSAQPSVISTSTQRSDEPASGVQPPSSNPPSASVYPSPAIAVSQSALDGPTSVAGSQAADPTTDAALSFTFAGSVFVASSATDGSFVAVASDVVQSQSGSAAPTTIAVFASQSLAADDPASSTIADPVTASFALGGQTVTAAQDSQDPNVVNIGSTQVTAGGSAVVVNGATVSLGPSGLYVGDTNTGATALDTVLGGQTIAATQLGNGQSGVVIAGSTLSAGGAAATISGTIVSAVSGGVVVDGTQTVSLGPGPSQQMSATALLTLGTNVITASRLPGDTAAALISGSTISNGGSPVTIDGTVLSLGTEGVVIGGTQTVSLGSDPTQQASNAAVLTIGTNVVTASEVSGSNAAVVVSGSTIFSGGLPVTINGSVISFGSGGIVVDGSRTVPLPSITNAPSSSGSSSQIAAAGATSASTATSLANTQRSFVPFLLAGLIAVLLIAVI
ncbi:hypothetical protein LTR17_016823 [Elasticomyces elasticus]|nr:hypothetical protein LTR17_016823 [Elasticomyces elasticus]